jgi:hypothetical protein
MQTIYFEIGRHHVFENRDPWLQVYHLFLLGNEPLEASDQLHRTRGRLFGRFHNSEMF